MTNHQGPNPATQSNSWTLIDTRAAKPTSTAATKTELRAQASELGLYRPTHEKDACGVGFIANMKGENSHRIVRDGLQILVNLTTVVPLARTR